MAAMMALPALGAVGSMGGFGTLMSIASIGVGFMGTMMQAQQAQAAAAAQAQQAQVMAQSAQFQAKQLEAKGKWEFAAQQAQMLQQRRQKQLAHSRLRARQANSGFEATDVTGILLGDEIEKYGTLQEAYTMAGAGMAYNDAFTAAGVQRYNAANYMNEASAHLSAGKTAAMGTIVGGIGNMFSGLGKIATQKYQFSQLNQGQPTGVPGTYTGGSTAGNYYYGGANTGSAPPLPTRSPYTWGYM